ncbi:hydrogenase maturation protease [Burkholderia ubonensis]|uniref:hydrogenase maturation protease n=1 Tax=Burkholderia ubonensis TaxID=101571 RepID=UPI000753FD0E|nr:hydrogenase maturation protease [Burkholderia ubonensis]KVD88275.1 hydrogenase maturation protease [Burkholderia ubonensis]
MTDTIERQVGRPAIRSVRVIGVGNPDRGDDGIGCLVAKRLAGRLPADVSLLTRGGDVMDIGDDMADIDALVCIDAAAPTGSPGRVSRIDLAGQTIGQGTSFSSSHGLGLAEAIALAEALGTASRDIVIYAIEGSSFEHGAAMTPEVAAAADEVAVRVVAEVDRLRRRMKEGSSDA